MFRDQGKTAVGLAVLIALGAGCSTEPRTRIAQLAPYVGGRPPKIRQLPTRELQRPKTASSGATHNWIPRRGIENRWECIVVHHSASDRASPQSMRADHVNNRGWDALGYHFVIGNGVAYEDGKIHIGERWRRQMTGAHCKVPGNHYNEHGIGICLIGNLEAHRPTPKQLEALVELCAFLTRNCRINPSRILTHGAVTGKTACPGQNFSLAPVLRRISTMNSLSASTH